MKPIESNIEAILVAIPMILVLAGSFFHLDECFGSPAKAPSRRKGFSHQDEAGVTVCVEPDGRPYRVRRER